jgi:hypothetical protein
MAERRPDPHTYRVQVRLSERQRRALTKIARTLNMTLAEYIRFRAVGPLQERTVHD